MVYKSWVQQKMRQFQAQKRRKRLYKYTQEICEGNFKTRQQIDYPLMMDVVYDFWLLGTEIVCMSACIFGMAISSFVSPTMKRQQEAQTIVDSVQNSITSAQEQVEAIRAQQQDSILQPKIDAICKKLMEEYSNLDLTHSTASTLLGDLNQAYSDSYTTVWFYPLVPHLTYYHVTPECAAFFADYDEIRDSLTAKIAQLQDDAPIDVHALPETILPSDLLALSEANALDLVDPNVAADSQLSVVLPFIASGLQCALVGGLAVSAVALYYCVENKRTLARRHDYDMATDLCLRGKQMSTCTNGETPQPLKNLNFKNEADLCPETIAFATSPKDFDEFNRNFDEYINCCQYRYDDFGIAFNSDAFTPYISSDANLSQAK